MMRQKDLRLATRFGIAGKCANLERELISIFGVEEVEFDLNGFYDNMDQVIFLTRYKIPFTDDYYPQRRKMVQEILAVANNNGLLKTGDAIEDYGEHLYFVFSCKKWNHQ